MPGRVLLLVPARSYRTADFLAAASRMGLDLTIGSDGALPLGRSPVIAVNPADPDGSARRVLDRAGVSFDAVVAADAPMLLLAATLARLLGLPHNPADAVRNAADKRHQRERWAAARVAQPEFRVIPADAGTDAVLRAARAVGFPCVVKAISLSASQGVLRADDQTAASSAVSRVRDVLATARRPADEPLVIEAYLPGVELSIDGLLTEGRLTPLAVFDKPATPDGPTFAETLLITPSSLPEPILGAAVRTAELAARALGLVTGPVHAELRIADAQPAMLELAARCIGGLCSRVLRFPGGRSLEELVLASALGSDPPDFRADPACARGVFMLPVPRPGILRAVRGRAEAAAVPGITGLTISVPIGRPVRPLPDGDQYLGFIFAEADSHAAVAAALTAASRKVRAVIS